MVRRRTFSLVSLAVACGVTACRAPEVTAQKEAASVERFVVAMGTGLRLQVQAESRDGALLASEAAVRAVEAVSLRLSTWRADSELTRLNGTPARTSVDLSGALLTDLRKARRWSKATGGAFDPAIGALIELYDLRGDGRWPSDHEVWNCLPHCSIDELEVVRRSATRTKNLLRIDAGAFGKGAALDAAAEELLAVGANRAVLDFGGQLLLVGKSHEVHVCSVADPRDRSRPVVNVRLPRGCVATTANSVRRLQVGERSLGHILDPRTGRPARDFGSVTVWAQSAFAADCLSTALFVMGPDAAFQWAERHDGIEVLVLEVRAESDARLIARATTGLRDRLDAVAPELIFQQ